MEDFGKDLSQTSRRQLLHAAGALPLVAMGRTAQPGLSGQPLLARRALGLAPGLAYFNTASIGPTRRSVQLATNAAWDLIERDPVPMAYFPDPGTVLSDVDSVRGKVAKLLGCSHAEILLTRNTTDAITTIAGSIRLHAGDRVLMTDQEHEGGEVGWLHRARRDGVLIDRVALPLGDFDGDAILARFEAAIRPQTKVIAVSHVLSSTGLCMPINALSALARSRGILCVVDGAQAAGAMPVDVRALGCHAYAASGHKWMMGPKGTGFAFIAEEAAGRIEPPQWLNGRHFGANSAGLGPLTLMAGLGQAIDDVLALGLPRVEEHNLTLRQRFYDCLQAMPDLKLVSPPPGPLATALVAAVLPAHIDSKLLRDRMRNRHRVIVKMAEKRWFNGIRFSPHLFNSIDEVDRALGALGTEIAAWAR